MLVAQLTYDHLDKKKGDLQFTLGGFLRFWGHQMLGDFETVMKELGSPVALNDLPNTPFKLYDDDDILYYTGWLKNDDGHLMVQQFVLAWAMADSGCTTIKIKKDGEWVQEIG